MDQPKDETADSDEEGENPAKGKKPDKGKQKPSDGNDEGDAVQKPSQDGDGERGKSGQPGKRPQRNTTDRGDGEYEEGKEHTPFAGEQAKYNEEKGNAEYAEKSTNLVLDYLRNQKDRPDPELLKEMNWTDEDLREFVNRWEKLKRESTNDNGKRKWNDAIKSLGLKPAASKARQTDRNSDASGGNAESGGRSQPPAKYLRQFKAFRKSAAKEE